MKRGRFLLKTISTARSFLTLRHSAPQMDLSERYSYNPTLHWNPQVEEYFIKAYGADHFSRISNALTRPSCYSCIRVNTLKSTSDAVIEKLLAFVADTGFGNDFDGTEQKKSEDEKQNGYQNGDECCKDKCPLKRSLESGTVSKCQVPGLEYVAFVRGSGPHAIEYDYTCDRPVKEVIVSRKCAEAVLRGAQIYAPGLLACSANVEKGDLVAVSVAVEQPGSDGGWGVGITRGTILQGLQTDPQFLERNGMFIGQGTATLSRAGMFRVPEGIAVDMSSRVFKLPSFHGSVASFLQDFLN